MNHRASLPGSDINDLICRIYGSVDNALAWESVIQDVARLTGSECCALFSVKGRGNNENDRNIITREYQSHFSVYRKNYLIKDNVFSIIRNIDPGISINSADIFGKGGAKSSTVYKDFYGECGLLHFIGVNILVSDDLWINLASFRREEAGPYGAADKSFFGCIYPHVEQSVRMGSVINDRKIDSGLVLGLIDQLNHAAFILDDSTGISRANRRARSLLENGTIVTPYLYGDDTKRAGYFDGPANRGRPCEITLSERSENYRLITIRPVDEISGLPQFGNNGGRLVVVLQVGDTLTETIANIQKEFSLTPSEARVCAVAVRCSSSQEMAMQLNVSRETIRSHMKHIFLKMNITSHVELLQYIVLGGQAIPSEF